jgi:pyroglutamyl-peptidase
MPLVVLLTGFGSFPGSPFNPTGPLVHRLARLRRPALAGVRLVPHVFQTSYRVVDEELPSLLSRVKPDVLLMFGLSGRARCLHVETRARNAVSALIRDAEGQQSLATCILPGGPAALSFAGPSLRSVLAARTARVAAKTSRDAGRYLCNYLSWRAIEAAAKPGGPKLAAFIHVPRLREAASRRRPERRRPPQMQDLLRGIEAILHVMVAEARRRRHMKER